MFDAAILKHKHEHEWAIYKAIHQKNKLTPHGTLCDLIHRIKNYWTRVSLGQG